MALRVPSYIAAPIMFACLCCTAIIGYLWWQLQQAASVQIAIPSQNTTVQIPSTSSNQAIISPTAKEQISLLRQGDIYAAEGNWLAARDAYKQAVVQDSSLTALRKLAQAQLQTNQLNELTSTIDQLKKSGAKPEDIALLESIALLRTGELVAAKATLTNADDSPQKHYGLLLVHIAEGNHALAQQEADLVINGFEPALRSNANIIKSAYQEFALFPEGSDQHLITLLARALAQVQECDLALPLLSQVTKQQPSYRDAWIVQGFCELQTNRNEQAISSYETAYGLDPQKTATQYFLGQAYLRSNQYQNAITFFEYAIANGFEPVAEVRTLLAKAAELQGNSALAFAQYQELLQTNATIENYRAYITTALSLQSTQLAYEAAVQMTQQFSNQAESFELLGLSAEQLGNTEQAITAYSKALSLDSTRALSTERLTELQQQ